MLNSLLTLTSRDNYYNNVIQKRMHHLRFKCCSQKFEW